MSIAGSNNPFSCQPVVFSAGNSILEQGTITRNGNDFLFSVGFVWKINGTIYQNTEPITISINEAADGFNRIDNALLSTSNSIELQQGAPSESVALQPIAPETSVLLTSWNVIGDAIADQQPPVIGSLFLKKEYENSQIFNGGGSNVKIRLNTTGKNHIIITGALTSVAGLSLINLIENLNPSSVEYPHQGKDFYFNNKTGHTITLKNLDSSVEMPFVSLDGNDIIVPNNGIVFFKNNNYLLEEFFKSYDNFDISTKADLVSGKVPSHQLPSYVDDVIESVTFESLPATGESGKIYVTLNSNKQYRWGGTAYIEISSYTALWGSIGGTITSQIDLMELFNSKQNALTNPVTGTGTTNYIPKFTGASALGNSLIYDNGTNIGIGTTSPSEKLDVNGNLIVRSGGVLGGVSTSDYGILTLKGGYALSTGSQAKIEIRGYEGGGGTQGAIISYTNGTERMRIMQSGLVGIGTTALNAKLNIKGLSNLIRFQDDGAYLEYYNTANTVRNGYIQMNSASNARINVEIAQGLSIYTSASERMTITSSGNVGIGTTSPAGKLSILDSYYNTFFSDTSSQYGSGLILSGDAGSDQRSWKTFVKNGNGGVAMTFEVSTNGVGYGGSPTGLTYSEKMRITPSGNVGISTTNPYSPLQVGNYTGIGGYSKGTIATLVGAFDGSYPSLFIGTTDATSTQGKGGSIGFGGNTEAGSSPYTFAQIKGLKESTGGSYSGYLSFCVTPSGSDANTERMRISSNGNVGIGTTAPTYKLEVHGTFLAWGNSGSSLEVTNSTVNIGGGNSGLSLADEAFACGTLPNGDIRGIRSSYYEGVWMANETPAKFGLMPTFNELFVEGEMIQATNVPSNPDHASGKWIKIYDKDTNSYYFMPVYQ